MIPVLSVDAMRKSDAAAIAAGTPCRELMRRAGACIADAARGHGATAIVCGGGNNGGDGFAAALALHEAGIPCTLFLFSDRFSPDGQYFFDRCTACGIPVCRLSDGTELTAFDCVIDCLFGTGLRDAVRDDARAVIDAINRSGAYVVSADINSGLSGDGGEGECVISDITVSLAAFQPGHFLGRAKDVMREKRNCDIGIPPAETPYYLVERADAAAWLPPRRNDAHKGTFGYLTLLGGSLRYGGAIRLAAMANAAMRAGAGVVRLAAPHGICHALLPEILESTLFPMPDADGEWRFDPAAAEAAVQGVRTVAVGMGMGLSPETEALVEWLLTHFSGTLVLDADALNALAALGVSALDAAPASVILTPHFGEFSRLTGRSVAELRQAPCEAARTFAAAHGATVLLKGATTVVTDGASTYLIDRGCPGMATAGSGDVLSGILAALVSGTGDRTRLTALAAYLNGRAGELAQSRVNPVSMLASDTVSAIAEAVSELIDITQKGEEKDGF